MIQLNSPMGKSIVILLGKFLEDYSDHEIGHFYDRDDDEEIQVIMYILGNGHYVARHVVVLAVAKDYWDINTHDVLTAMAQDFNTLLNLKAPEVLSNTP